MSMNVGKSSLLLGLLLSFGVSAEELQKQEDAIEVNQETTEVNTSEEVTNWLFDEWYNLWAEKFTWGVCRLPDGYINRMALGRYIYLETFVKNNQDSAEKNPISFFIAKKLEEAKSKSKKQEAKWFLLDSKTRCKYVVENNISYIECLSCFKANDFEERFAKKEIESFKTAFGIEEFEGEFEGLENPQI